MNQFNNQISNSNNDDGKCLNQRLNEVIESIVDEILALNKKNELVSKSYANTLKQKGKIYCISFLLKYFLLRKEAHDPEDLQLVGSNGKYYDLLNSLAKNSFDNQLDIECLNNFGAKNNVSIDSLNSMRFIFNIFSFLTMLKILNESLNDWHKDKTNRKDVKNITLLAEAINDILLQRSSMIEFYKIIMAYIGIVKFAILKENDSKELLFYFLYTIYSTINNGILYYINQAPEQKVKYSNEDVDTYIKLFYNFLQNKINPEDIECIAQKSKSDIDELIKVNEMDKMYYLIKENPKEYLSTIEKCLSQSIRKYNHNKNKRGKKKLKQNKKQEPENNDQQYQTLPQQDEEIIGQNQQEEQKAGYDSQYQNCKIYQSTPKTKKNDEQQELSTPLQTKKNDEQQEEEIIGQNQQEEQKTGYDSQYQNRKIYQSTPKTKKNDEQQELSTPLQTKKNDEQQELSKKIAKIVLHLNKLQGLQDVNKDNDSPADDLQGLQDVNEHNDNNADNLQDLIQTLQDLIQKYEHELLKLNEKMNNTKQQSQNNFDNDKINQENEKILSEQIRDPTLYNQVIEKIRQFQEGDTDGNNFAHVAKNLYKIKIPNTAIRVYVKENGEVLYVDTQHEEQNSVLRKIANQQKQNSQELTTNQKSNKFTLQMQKNKGNSGKPGKKY